MAAPAQRPTTPTDTRTTSLVFGGNGEGVCACPSPAPTAESEVEEEQQPWRRGGVPWRGVAGQWARSNKEKNEKKYMVKKQRTCNAATGVRSGRADATVRAGAACGQGG